MSAPTYEFSDVQNVTISKLAGKLKSVGIILFVMAGLAALQLLQNFTTGEDIFITAGLGVVYLLMGLWTHKAGQAYAKIVSTEGSDINHLMSAQEALLKLYSLQFWLFIVFIIVTVLVGIMIGISSSSTPTSL